MSLFRTAIFMPGDRIIREGERGTEMFFMSEGTAEIIIRRTNNQSNGKLRKDSNVDTNAQPSILRIHKKKGDFFGEVSQHLPS